MKQSTETNYEKHKFYFDIIKWFFGSVVIVIVTLIIDRGFKERAAGIQEMQVYDKYVEIILEADNIEKRWKLCEYFAIVTPTERLRNRWIAYQDLIKEDYAAFTTLAAEEEKLETEILKMEQQPQIASGIQKQRATEKLLEVQRQKDRYEQTLAPPQTTEATKNK